MFGGADSDVVADVDTACFQFHLKHFCELAQERGVRDPEEEDMLQAEVENYIMPPLLHQLPVELLERLLVSGLIDMGSQALSSVVCRFAAAHCEGGYAKEDYRTLCARLHPPNVLFNRTHRSSLLPRTVGAGIDSVL
eukprot:TRINITY_DN12921_c0_g1_i1.p1 TRINITY_DN12921_c0_g1~~TRINITY_DN12921_c0_g1_i1.p1  ORF type:complete len:137 (-),score=32.95 TRINITY_DN12921_c0_g1_i1:361-771(-)